MGWLNACKAKEWYGPHSGGQISNSQEWTKQLRIVSPLLPVFRNPVRLVFNMSGRHEVY